VEGVTDLMRQRADLVERAVEVGEDAAFFHGGYAHAECAAAFAFALFTVDPILSKVRLAKAPSSGENLLKFSTMKSRASSNE
jgi:hypothetical protein